MVLSTFYVIPRKTQFKFFLTTNNEFQCRKVMNMWWTCDQHKTNLYGHQRRKLINMEGYFCVPARNKEDYTKVSQSENSTNNLRLYFCLPFSDTHYSHMFNYWNPIFNINIFLLIFSPFYISITQYTMAWCASIY